MSEDKKIQRLANQAPPVLPDKYNGVTPEEWQQALDQDPEMVAEAKVGGQKYKYIPISYTSRKLDQLTGGVWSHTEPKIELHDVGYTDKGGNPTPIVILTIGVTYYNPVSLVTITRYGVADGLYYKGKSKLNIPALKSEAFKNAVKEMGRALGRELNRGIQETISVDEALERWEDRIAEAKNRKDLEKIQKGVSAHIRNSQAFKDALNNRMQEIKSEGND